MNDYIEVKQIFSIAFRRWWLIIGFAIIGASFGFLISQRQTPVYEATTTILVGEILESTDLDRTDILTSQLVATTYAEMVRRQPVLEGVVESLNLTQSWRQLEDQVKVNLIEGTQLIQIIVEAPSPLTAQLLVDEITNQLIAFSPTQTQFQETANTQSFVQQQLESLQSRLESGQNRRASLDLELVSTNSTERLEEIQSEIDVLDGLIAEWENNYTQLLVFLGNRQSPNNLTIIEPAQASNYQISPNTKLNTLIGSGVGIFLALGLIFLLEFLDDSIKSVDEVQQGFGTLILGTIPKIKGLDYENKLAVFQDQMSSTSEVFRLIGGNLQLFSTENTQKTIMITSPNQSEGKSLIIASLGTVLAQAGLATIIVDANLRRPIIHEMFKVKNNKGLMDLLSREKYDIGEYLQKTEFESLSLLTIGSSEINPSSLLMQEKVNKVINTLKDRADVVLFDSSSALDHADSAFLSTRVDGVILLVAAKRTKKDQVNKSIQNLDLTSANLSGIVFNKYIPGKLTLMITKLRLSIRNRFSKNQSRRDISLAGKMFFTKFSLKRR